MRVTSGNIDLLRIYQESSQDVVMEFWHSMMQHMSSVLRYSSRSVSKKKRKHTVTKKTHAGDRLILPELQITWHSCSLCCAPG